MKAIVVGSGVGGATELLVQAKNWRFSEVSLKEVAPQLHAVTWLGRRMV
jgi:hypothetical protein